VRGLSLRAIYGTNTYYATSTISSGKNQRHHDFLFRASFTFVFSSDYSFTVSTGSLNLYGKSDGTSLALAASSTYDSLWKVASLTTANGTASLLTTVLGGLCYSSSDGAFISKKAASNSFGPTHYGIASFLSASEFDSGILSPDRDSESCSSKAFEAKYRYSLLNVDASSISDKAQARYTNWLHYSGLDSGSSASSSSVSASSSSAISSSETPASSPSSSIASSSTSEGFALTSATGLLESASCTFPSYSGATSYQGYYQLSGNSTWNEIPAKLIRSTASGYRMDIPGLSAGSYLLKVVPVVNGSALENEAALSFALTVSAYDRSGYAHFAYSSGVGAYQDNGTLKTGAIVVYVDNDTKNSVTTTLSGTTYTGLIAILQGQKNSSLPLDIRVLGTLSTNQFAAKSLSSGNAYDDANASYFESTLETPYATNLTGLRCKAWAHSAAQTYWNLTASHCASSGYTFDFATTTSSSSDSYFNMADITGVSNVTVEGIGDDATIEQWGFTWSKSNLIEVRNLTFENAPEDSCSFQGGGNSDMDYHHFWLHHCLLNKGLNNWDISDDQDKKEGDGNFDLKYLGGVTSSYNHFHNDHKTGLVGWSDSVLTKDVSFHHNEL
jgi:pectate lyase